MRFRIATLGSRFLFLRVAGGTRQASWWELELIYVAGGLWGVCDNAGMAIPPPPSAPTPPPGNSSQSPPGLTPEQLIAIQDAEKRVRKIQRAVTVARIDGGLTALFGVFGLLSFCLGWQGPVIGAFLCVVAFNAFRCAGKLDRLDPRAPALLAMNQLYLAAIIILYALYQLYVGPDTSSLKQLEELGEAGGKEIADLYRTISMAVYLALIAGTIVAQGLTALYYMTRRRFVDAYLKETPQWLIDLRTRTRSFPMITQSGR